MVIAERDRTELASHLIITAKYRKRGYFMSFSEPPITRRHLLALVGGAAGSWFFPAFAKDAKNPLEQALAVWKMATTDGAGRYPIALRNNVAKELRLGQKLSRAEYYESLRRGGDGVVAIFDKAPADNLSSFPTNEDHGCLSVNALQVKKLRSSTSAFSFYIRTFFDEPDGWGTLFFSDFFGLAMHQSGLAIAFLGQRTSEGTTFRELPLGTLERGTWLDLIIRIDERNLELSCNGEVRNSIPLTKGLGVPFESELLIGAYPGLRENPEKRSLYLSNAKIDTIGIWDFILTDAQVTFLSGVTRLRPKKSEAPADNAIMAYNQFYDASANKDLALCRQLDRSMRDFMRQDVTRPIYHLTAPIGWIFDPSAAFNYHGGYHVFSYRNIYAILRFCSNDHYASDDMVHWRMWPTAPVADSPLDAYCIWTGNHFIDDQGLPNVLYSGGVHGGRLGIRARSHDGMVSYTDKKMVLPGYHDGHVWKEDDAWYTITMDQGNGVPEIGIFSSPDLEHWTKRNILFSLPRDKCPYMEFPYLVSMGDKDVLMAGCFPSISGARYWIGHFDRKAFKFIPDDPSGLDLDYANPFLHCFNPLITDAKGLNGAPRRIIMAMNAQVSGTVDNIPWNGVHAMPRALSLEGDHLRQDPLPEFKALRGKHYFWQNIKIAPGKSGYSNVRGDALEIMAEFKNNDATTFGMRVRLSPDGETFVRIFYDAKTNEYGVDGNIARPGTPNPQFGRGPSFLSNGEVVQMRIFLDKALIETFVNGQTCTASLKDTNPLHDRLDLFSEGGPVVCNRLDIWEMTSAR